MTSLRAKLLLTLLISAAALLGALALLWSTGTRYNQELVDQTSRSVLDNALSDLQERGEVTLEHLAGVLPNLVYYYDFKGLAEALSPVLARPDVIYVQVFDNAGRIVHDGSRVLERFGEHMTDELAPTVVSASAPLALWADSHVDVSRPLLLGSEPMGGVRVGLSRTGADLIAASKQAELQTQLRARFDRQMQWLFAVFGLLLLLAAATAWIVGRGLLRPIRALADATDRLEHGRFEGVELPHHREDELGNLIQNFNRMVRALRDHEQSIRQLAYQDPLTGLPNRLMFRELLDQAIAERIGHPASRLGLLFIDLDDFKRVNDTLGHDAGDTLLGEFATRLQGRLSKAAEKQESDKPLIARLGGDEFVALVSGDDLEERCEALASTMLELLTEPFEIEGRSLWLGTSIGITTFPEDARTSRHLLKCGDLAMYQAKLEGKNGVCWYHDRLTATAEENLALEQDLRQALQQDQLDVVYQPVVCMRTGRVTGAEALLRWRHPQRGEIEPEQFVAVAEGSTLINELGRFAMMRACKDAAEWQRRCPGLRVGINVSARQLMRRDLSDLVDEAIQASNLPAQCMSLELTESSLMQDRTVTANTLAELRKRDINVWLDDFGTGFSGLNHMRQLQVHGVKIDRSFIADITTDPDDLALTSAIIAMAHSIGMRVIAEGVETREQLTLLTERNCDLAQGFLIARPMKAGEIPDFRPDPALLPETAGAAPARF